MKMLILALSLLSIPAFAQTSNDVASQEADARICLGGNNFGVCIGDRGPGRPGPGGPGWDHGGGHGGPGWDHGGPGHGGWGPGPGPRGVVCDAQNLRGNLFRGFGRWVREAQDNAISNCYRAGSRSCRILGCR